MEENIENIKLYLEQAAKLESSVYEQQKGCALAKSNIVMPVHSEPKLPEPVLKQAYCPRHPGKIQTKKGLLAFFILVELIGLVVLIIGISSRESDAIIPGALFLASGSLLLGVWIAFYVKMKKDYNESVKGFNAAMDNYKVLQETYRKDNDEAMNLYRIQVEEAKISYEKEYAEKVKCYEEAQKTLLLMNSIYDETKKTLENVYAHNVIFPKYRNMTAMFTMLEYFQTGRVSELTGPNGAYNLYEAEVRQNIIINKLDTIISKLDQIKENQFLLYSEMRNISGHLSSINQNTMDLLDTNKHIEANTAITAHCAQITAQNTAALAVMATLS